MCGTRQGGASGMNVGPTPGPQGRHRQATCAEGEAREAGQGRLAGRFPTYLRGSCRGGRAPSAGSQCRREGKSWGWGRAVEARVPPHAARPRTRSLERLPSSPSLLPSGEVGRGGARAHKPQKAPRPARPDVVSAGHSAERAADPGERMGAHSPPAGSAQSRRVLPGGLSGGKGNAASLSEGVRPLGFAGRKVKWRT